MSAKAAFQLPAEQLEELRERALRRGVTLDVVLREAVELVLDADERELEEYFGPARGARRVRFERAAADVGGRW